MFKNRKHAARVKLENFPFSVRSLVVSCRQQLIDMEGSGQRVVGGGPRGGVVDHATNESQGY